MNLATVGPEKNDILVTFDERPYRCRGQTKRCWMTSHLSSLRAAPFKADGARLKVYADDACSWGTIQYTDGKGEL